MEGSGQKKGETLINLFFFLFEACESYRLFFFFFVMTKSLLLRYLGRLTAAALVIGAAVYTYLTWGCAGDLLPASLTTQLFTFSSSLFSSSAADLFSHQEDDLLGVTRLRWILFGVCLILVVGYFSARTLFDLLRVLGLVLLCILGVYLVLLFVRTGRRIRGSLDTDVHHCGNENLYSSDSKDAMCRGAKNDLRDGAEILFARFLMDDLSQVATSPMIQYSLLAILAGGVFFGLTFWGQRRSVAASPSPVTGKSHRDAAGDQRILITMSRLLDRFLLLPTPVRRPPSTPRSRGAPATRRLLAWTRSPPHQVTLSK